MLLLPLALSITQDDKAHLRWTLFGNSEQTPAHAFWKGFFAAPDRRFPAEQAKDFFRDLLAKAYEEPRERLHEPDKAGFRILASAIDETLPGWTSGISPVTEAVARRQVFADVSPFRDLPAAVRQEILGRRIALIAVSRQLVVLGHSGLWPPCGRFAAGIAGAAACISWNGTRRSGKFASRNRAGSRRPAPPTPGGHGRLPLRDTYKRTYRHGRAHRYDDHLVNAHEHRLAHTLFSTLPHDIDLYHKPMGRNVQLWTDDFQPLLDGPSATPDDIRRAATTVARGGVFGYRFLFPAMRVGRHELYWHRPLVGYLNARTNQPALIDRRAAGLSDRVSCRGNEVRHAIGVWPRLQRREVHIANIECFGSLKETPPHCTMVNVLKLLDARKRHGQPLAPSFARQLLTVPKRLTLEGWLRGLPAKAKPTRRERASRLVEHLRTAVAFLPSPHGKGVGGEGVSDPAASLTFQTYRYPLV